MLKDILNQKGVKKLEKNKLTTINGGAQEYLCWGEGNHMFVSDTDLSGSVVHCSPIAVVTPKEEDKGYLYPADGVRK